jgi:hypothetical protein
VRIEAEGERDNAFGLRIESRMPQHTTHKDGDLLWGHLTVGDRRHHHATIAVGGWHHVAEVLVFQYPHHILDMGLQGDLHVEEMRALAEPSQGGCAHLVASSA